LLNHGHDANSSYGIMVAGNISSDSEIDIEANNPFNKNSFNFLRNIGVAAYYGSKRNIHVIGNSFIGGGNHIAFRGSPQGGVNDISDNTFNLGVNRGNGVVVMDFPGIKVCTMDCR
jgi:hypothetical protein